MNISLVIGPFLALNFPCLSLTLHHKDFFLAINSKDMIWVSVTNNYSIFQVDDLANDWESFQTTHFSQIEEFDLVFK